MQVLVSTPQLYHEALGQSLTLLTLQIPPDISVARQPAAYQSIARQHQRYIANRFLLVGADLAAFGGCSRLPPRRPLLGKPGLSANEELRFR